MKLNKKQQRQIIERMNDFGERGVRSNGADIKQLPDTQSAYQRMPIHTRREPRVLMSRHVKRVLKRYIIGSRFKKR
ncbi:hypothetical protein [Bacillus altitudinis]|uniref:hypothetical protein n=1 Tax=Bacillus altitudinis TaxID=293387 RepID=UPI0024095D38|nr:hypothetical protein [Bacillus altitudinis]WEZ69947.1 hypothetical protein P5623_12010 [Bacillus altitudinis]